MIRKTHIQTTASVVRYLLDSHVARMSATGRPHGVDSGGGPRVNARLHLIAIG